ncbi:hypothetical protein H0H92_012869 [Tricholoma furcatifolium]|nr:hypothetical protein H0H92_012869 [Tricholoma furcatifolium]
MPAARGPSSSAAHHRNTAPRYHPYVSAPRPTQMAIVPAPIPPPANPVPSTRRRGPFYTPPHPLDPEFAIHPPMSPREIHRRQQVLRGRRLTALFCIPEFHRIVRSGWVTARWEETQKEASMSTDSKDNTSESATD